MKSVFVKWASEHHKFSCVRLTPQDLSTFSGAVKELLDKQPGDNGNDVYQFLTLQYTFPAVPKAKGEKAKPLTNDQKHQNLMFMRCLKRVWREVKEETQDRVNEVNSVLEMDGLLASKQCCCVVCIAS
jgi:hypothetical protein